MIDCRFIARLLGLLSLAATAAVPPLCASQPTKKTLVASTTVAPASDATRLLELGDRYSPTALAKARECHDELRAGSGYNDEIRYAFALVLIRQHCEAEAVEALDALLAHQPDAMHVWRAKIWAEMSLHKEREALADARAVAAVLGQHRPTALPAGEADDWRATAEFLGRLFGFLEVPRPKAVADDDVRRTKQFVLAKLGDEKAVFNANEELVFEKLSKAQAAAEDLRSKRVAAGKTKHQALGQQKKALGETETSVDFDSEKLKTNTKTEVDRLNQVAEMVNKNILTCQFRLNGLRQAIQVNQAKLDIQTQKIESQGPPPSDPVLGASRVPDLVTQTQLIELLTRLTAEQALLTKQVSQLTEELRNTIAQRDALLELGDQSTAELKTQAASLKRDGKKLERAQQAEARKIAVERQRTLLTKQTAFATLEPFPYGTEKQRVVGAVDP